jgi:hypothetical protein
MESLKKKKPGNRIPGNKKFLKSDKKCSWSYYISTEQVEDRISGLRDKIDIKEKTK